MQIELSVALKVYEKVLSIEHELGLRVTLASSHNCPRKSHANG